MRIFTERAFREELARRISEREKEEILAQQIRRMNEQIDCLEHKVEGIHIDVVMLRDQFNKERKEQCE